jgi:hypothetical protein
MRMLRLPAARPVSLRIASGYGYFPSSLSFRSPRVEEFPRCAWALVFRFRHTAPVRSKGRSQSDLSSSQGTLSCLCPALRPRSDLHAKPLRRFDSAPAVLTTKAPTSDHYFEAQSHGFSTRSIRFVPTSLPTTQCSLPAGGQPLPGGVLYPLGPCTVFPSLVFYSITCSSSLSGFA